MALILKKKKKDHDEHHDDHPIHYDHSEHPPEEGEGWLVSYADMMTLLCGFFIMMFSMAKIDEPKFEKVKESVAKEFGGEYHPPSGELARFVTQVLQEAGVEKETTVRSDPMGVSVTFHATIFFETLSSELKEKGLEVMKKVTEALAERQKLNQVAYKIVVEGHTDSRPILSGPYPSNWELSSARASRVVRMFLDQGYPAKQLTAIGYADTYPENPERKEDGNFDEEAMAKNRRVVVRILMPSTDHIPLPASAPNAEIKTSDQQLIQEAQDHPPSETPPEAAATPAH
jgi:chemotaxis protein MotB